MKKIHRLFIGLLPIQWLGLLLIKNHPSWIETYYSQKFYPFLFNVYRFLFDKIPFSVGDLLYVIIVIHIIKEVFMVIKKRKIQLFFLLRNGLSALSLILIVFNINLPM